MNEEVNEGSVGEHDSQDVTFEDYLEALDEALNLENLNL